MSGEVKPLSEIRNFVELLEESLKRKVFQYTLKPLTKPGCNFGATLQSVEVKVTGKSDSDNVSTQKILHSNGEVYNI